MKIKLSVIFTFLFVFISCFALQVHAEILRDIPYVLSTEEVKADALQKLDIYLPENKKFSPVLVFIHGGGWRGGDKKNHEKKGEFFTKRGYVFISINYRLLPKAKHPLQIEDVASALNWIQENISQFKGKPDEIYILGHSAGAYLTALISTDEQHLNEHELGLDIIKGAMLIDSATYDLFELRNQNKKLFKRLCKPNFGSRAKDLGRASPLYHVEPGKGIPPFLIVHQMKRTIARTQAQWLAEALSSSGIFARVVAVSGTHSSLNKQIGVEGDPTTKAIMDFLNSENKL